MEKTLLTAQELADIERNYADGLTLAQLLEAFSERQVHLSEATFRKYVQLGLIGRSKRVGRKGKHQGSLGMYPVSTVGQLNTIREMMAAHYTIEDIQRSFLRFRNSLSALKKMTTEMLALFQVEIEQAHFSKTQKKELQKEWTALQQQSEAWLDRMARMEQALVSPLQRSAREKNFASGAGMGADDLL